MPKKKTPALDPKEQFKRFEEAAKQQGMDQHQAEKAFAAVAKAGKGESSKQRHKLR